MDTADFKDKFIGFIDVLGFTHMIEAAERGEGRPLAEIRELLADLGRQKDKSFYEQYGPQICPKSARQENALDFEITQVTDSAICSAEISPAGVINLINHCWAAAMILLTKGVLVRGYITRGQIFHRGTEFMGTGYVTAYRKESGVVAFKREADEKGTPFIEIDPTVCEYVKNETDDCVRKMFRKYVKSDQEVTAVFPFQLLSHSFSIGGFGLPKFNPVEEKKSNDNLRRSLQLMTAKVAQYVDRRNASAVRKAAHYIAALDAQLKLCDETDHLIDRICGPYPS